MAARERERASKTREMLFTVEKARNVKRLRAEIEQRQSEQKAAEAVLELERSREEHLRGKLDRLRQQAIRAGKPPAPTELKPGVSVYQGQILARIVSEQ